MSRNTRRRSARAEDLVEELSLGAAQRLRCTSDDVQRIVHAVVSYLVEEYPAQDLYIPSSLDVADYPVEEIRRAIAAGQSVRSICKRHHVGRRKLYQLLNVKPQRTTEPA